MKTLLEVVQVLLCIRLSQDCFKFCYPGAERRIFNARVFKEWLYYTDDSINVSLTFFGAASATVRRSTGPSGDSSLYGSWARPVLPFVSLSPVFIDVSVDRRGRVV